MFRQKFVTPKFLPFTTKVGSLEALLKVHIFLTPDSLHLSPKTDCTLQLNPESGQNVPLLIFCRSPNLHS